MCLIPKPRTWLKQRNVFNVPNDSVVGDVKLCFRPAVFCFTAAVVCNIEERARFPCVKTVLLGISSEPLNTNFMIHIWKECLFRSQCLHYTRKDAVDLELLWISVTEIILITHNSHF